MQDNYTIIKRNRKMQRFFRFTGLYFLLWFVFRYAIEAFRGNNSMVILGNIIWTGLLFSVLLGMYSLYKNEVLYINKNRKDDITDWLDSNNFKMTKQAGKVSLYIQSKKERFGRHKELVLRDLGEIIEVEFDAKLKEELSNKLVTL